MLEYNKFGKGIDKLMNSKGLKKMVLEAENKDLVLSF